MMHFYSQDLNEGKKKKAILGKTRVAFSIFILFAEV